jgi:hypothetical protein
VVEPAASGLPGVRLKASQPELLLELAAGVLGARAVVVDTGLAAILGHQRDDQVRVVCAASRAAVANRDPPALRPGGLAGKAHLLDELLQISAHRSSASSRSCGCRLNEQCHTCASRVPIKWPSLSRSAMLTLVPNSWRGSSRNRASAAASLSSSSRPCPIVTATRDPATRWGSECSSRLPFPTR